MHRRTFVTTTAAFLALSAAPSGGWALTNASAKRLVGQMVGEINKVIAARPSEPVMFREFERILVRYGDMNTIAQATLGPDGRSASAADKRAYQQALQGYIARKYGKRFREFIGGEIEVTGVKKINRYFEVNCIARLQGQAPFAVDFMVSDRSGKDLFFDMKIEGISLLRSEQREIGALLDKRRGNIGAVTKDLKKLG